MGLGDYKMKRDIKTYDDLFNLSWSEIVDEFHLIDKIDAGTSFIKYTKGIPGYVAPWNRKKMWNLLYGDESDDKKE